MKKSGMFKKLFGMLAVVCLMALMFGMTTLAADKTEALAVGQTVINEEKDGATVHYYKFTVKTSGFLVVSGMEVDENYYLPVDISVCNAKGKVLITESVNAASAYDELKTASFALNKGTYKLKIKSPREFRITTAFKKWTEKSGKTQKKAVSLKKKAVKKGVVGLGESAGKTDWYKVVLKKPAKISLEFDTYTNGTLYATIIPAKSTKVSGTYSMYSYNQPVNRTLAVMPGNRNLPKGTYYIKVYRATKKSSVNGVYTLKWKK